MNIFEKTILDLKLPEAHLYLFGDGSGTVYTKPCSSICIVYDFERKQYSLKISSYSHGTNNFAELVPYIHALWSYEYNYKTLHNVKVEIISDSEVTVKQGNGEYNRSHGPNAMLWQSVDWFTNHGYQLHWNHVSRNSNRINELCDKIAGIARKNMLTSIEDYGKMTTDLNS